VGCKKKPRRLYCKSSAQENKETISAEAKVATILGMSCQTLSFDTYHQMKLVPIKLPLLVVVSDASCRSYVRPMHGFIIHYAEGFIINQVMNRRTIRIWKSLYGFNNNVPISI
jgi:hypothetical protein